MSVLPGILLGGLPYTLPSLPCCYADGRVYGRTVVREALIELLFEYVEGENASRVIDLLYSDDSDDPHWEVESEAIGLINQITEGGEWYLFDESLWLDRKEDDEPEGDV